jgi:hypothetical protein
VRHERGLGRAIALCAIVSALYAAGCATDDEDRAPRDGGGHGQTAGQRSAEGRADRDGIRPVERALPERALPDRNPAGPDRSSPAPRLKPATCPPGAGNCRSATGRVIYVERVDPDGDGDAHFVLASRQSITGPGISVIDVKRSLRPSPLPGRGDRLSAAGPVHRGSYGQRQIQAVELHVARIR